MPTYPVDLDAKKPPPKQIGCCATMPNENPLKIPNENPSELPNDKVFQDDLSTPTMSDNSESNQNDDNKSNKTESDIDPENIKSFLDLTNYIKVKKRRLEESKKILELKYTCYKRCYDFWNISTIILSTGLTLIESCKLIFLPEDGVVNNLTRDFFNLSPIILGSVITCSASILKFKKYQESMEETYIVIDKCINMISKLKNKKEQIKLLDEDELGDIKKDYLENICPEYSAVFQETERYISPDDYRKYLHIINRLEYHKHRLFHEKHIFFHKYKPEKADKMSIDEIETDLNKGSKCCC